MFTTLATLRATWVASRAFQREAAPASSARASRDRVRCRWQTSPVTGRPECIWFLEEEIGGNDAAPSSLIDGASVVVRLRAKSAALRPAA